MGTLLNLVAPAAALGAAEHALEVFQERLMVRNQKNTVESRQADSPLAQARFSRAFGLVATARLHWNEALTWLAAQTQSGFQASDREKAAFRLSLALSAASAQEAVQLAVSGSGGSVHRLSHPLQRIQRDVGVLVNHPTLSIDPILEQSGRGILGLGFTVPGF
jgi:GTP cyclohydrolase II